MTKRTEGEGPNPSGLCMCGCGETTPIAPFSRPDRGHIFGTPTKFIAGHQRRKSHLEYLADPSTGCWVWQRATNDLGYGQVTRDKQVVYAHRDYYETAHGPIPKGHVIDHVCGNPSCVNPDHLEAVTNGENIRRGSRGLGPVRHREFGRDA